MAVVRTSSNKFNTTVTATTASSTLDTFLSVILQRKKKKKSRRREDNESSSYYFCHHGHCRDDDRCCHNQNDDDDDGDVIADKTMTASSTLVLKNLMPAGSQYRKTQKRSFTIRGQPTGNNTTTYTNGGSKNSLSPPPSSLSWRRRHFRCHCRRHISRGWSQMPILLRTSSMSRNIVLVRIVRYSFLVILSIMMIAAATTSSSSTSSSEIHNNSKGTVSYFVNGLSLGGGIYNTTPLSSSAVLVEEDSQSNYNNESNTNGHDHERSMIQQLLGLSLDLDRIQQQLDKGGGLETAIKIYNHGMDDNDNEGTNTTQKSSLTLASLSVDWTTSKRMSDDPIFNLYKFYHQKQREQKEHAAEGISSISSSNSSNVGGDENLRHQRYYHRYPVEQYAHENIMKVFEESSMNEENEKLSTETTIGVVTHSILVHSVWMAVVHELTNVYWTACHSHSNISPTHTTLTSLTESLLSLDRAVALWIGARNSTDTTTTTNGKDDSHGRNNNIFKNTVEPASTSENARDNISAKTRIVSLYQLAEETDTKFLRNATSGSGDYGDSDSALSLSSNWVNDRLLDTFNTLQRLLSDASGKDSHDVSIYCKADSSSSSYDGVSIRQIIYRSINIMTIPLVQNWILLDFLLKDNDDGDDNVLAGSLKDVYSAALAPQLMACDPTLVFPTPGNDDTTVPSTSKISSDLLETSLSCLRLTQSEIGVYNGGEQADRSFAMSSPASTSNSLVGYIVSSNDAIEKSRIDRDVFQLDIFLRFGSYIAAMDWYQYGYNTDISLKHLALGSYLPANTTASQFEIFQNYYNTSDFGDVEITKALSFEAEFENATNEEVNAVVRGLIRYQVVYLSVVSWLQLSVDQCTRGSSDDAIKYWDQGAAVYVGSMEGKDFLGTPYGQLLFNVSETLCPSFDTCESSSFDNTTNAIVNRLVISALKMGKNTISSNNCRQGQNLLEESIIPAMQVPLIQSTILSSVTLYNQTKSTSYERQHARGDAHASSKSVLPLINEAQQSSAETVGRILTFGHFDSSNSTALLDEILEAFRLAIPGMRVKCIDIGSILDTGKDVCPNSSNESSSGSSQQATEQPLLLQAPGLFNDADSLVDLFNFSGIDCSLVGDAIDAKDEDMPLCGTIASDILPMSVRPFATIGIDVAYMKGALRIGNQSMAEDIYRNGMHFFVKGTGFISLQSLSLTSTIEMLGDPVFNLFLNYYNDRREYGDDHVRQNFAAEGSFLPAEASVILNTWMYVVHLLQSSIEMCTEVDFDASAAIFRVDLALAYWLGDAKERKSGGNLMYGIADEMDKLFSIVGRKSYNANERILSVAEEMKEVFAPTDMSCTPSSNIHLLRLVHESVRSMTVPLLQGLIHSLKVNDKNRAILYSKSVIPLLGVCDSRDFEFMRDIFRSNYDVSRTDDILNRIYRSLDCLGLTCQSLGIHYTDISLQDGPSQCDVATTRTTDFHAGYNPGPTFYEYSRLDLDLREIGILTEMGASKSALDIFIAGKNTNTSLADISLSADIHHVPHYSAYSNYFGSNVYSHDLLSNILLSGDVLDLSGPSNRQRSILAKRFTQSLVLQHGALEAIFVTFSHCQESEIFVNAKAKSKSILNYVADYGIVWDKAAAFLLGSISRVESSQYLLDHEDWYSPFDLAQSECLKFGTCEPGEIAPINKRTIKLINTGREASSMLNCEGMKMVGDEIQALLLVPLIQAFLSSFNAIISKRENQEDKVVETYVFLEILMPRLVDIDRASAERLKQMYFRTMEGDGSHPNYSHVVSLMAHFFKELKVDCNFIGSLNGIDACQASSVSTETNSGKGLSSLGILLIVLFVALPCVFVSAHLLITRRLSRLPNKDSKDSCQDIEDTQNVFDASFLSTDDRILFNEGDSIDDEDTEEDSEMVPLNNPKRSPFFSRMRNRKVRSSDRNVSFESIKSCTSDFSTVSRDLAHKSYGNRINRSLSHEAMRTTGSIDNFQDDLPFVVDEVSEENSSSGRSTSRSSVFRKGRLELRQRKPSFNDDDDDDEDGGKSSERVHDHLNKHKQLFDPTLVPNPSGDNLKKNVSFALPFGVDIDTDSDDYYAGNIEIY